MLGYLSFPITVNVVAFLIMTWIEKSNAQYLSHHCKNNYPKYQYVPGCFNSDFLRDVASKFSRKYGEGSETHGYVLKEKFDGSVPAETGVQIAQAIDLGVLSEQWLLTNGDMNRLGDALMIKILPYFGKTGSEAEKFLADNPLEISYEEAENLTEAVVFDLVKSTKQRFQEASSAPLSRAQSTVLISLNFLTRGYEHKVEAIWEKAVAGDWIGVRHLLPHVYESLDYDSVMKDRRMEELQILNDDENMETCCSGGILYHGQCFFEGPDTRSYDEARRYCQSRQGDLAIITDSSTVKEVIPDARQHWVGAADCTSKSQFTWVDGSQIDNDTYTQLWVHDGPIVTNISKCATIANGKLEEYDCMEALPFWCEVSMQEHEGLVISKNRRKEEILIEQRASNAPLGNLFQECSDDKIECDIAILSQKLPIFLQTRNMDDAVGGLNEEASRAKRNIIHDGYWYWLWNQHQLEAYKFETVNFIDHEGNSNSLELRKEEYPVVIEYQIKYNDFVAGEVSSIELAISEIMEKTCIVFQEIYGGDSSIGYYMEFQKSPDGGCWSYVGRTSDVGPMPINLGRTGYNYECTTIGTVIHEIMHSLGFWHEHSRPDRDDYIEIRLSNVIPGREENFEKLSTDFAITLGHGYDYSSLMHYSSLAYAIDPTISTIVPLRQTTATIGQRTSLSPNDIAEINSLYKCQTPIDGGWSEWSVWSWCSETCDSGIRIRTRECTLPLPKMGGKFCEGSDVISEACSTHHCPWGEMNYRWTGCWLDMQGTRMQYIGNLIPNNVIEENIIEECGKAANTLGMRVFGLMEGECFGLEKEMLPADYVYHIPSDSCNAEKTGGVNSLDVYTIVPDCDVTDAHASCPFWASIGECTENPNYMLSTCTLSCNVEVCDNQDKEIASIQGYYGVWGPYSLCSKTCVSSDGEPGYKTRERFCNNPNPDHSADLPCEGPREETVECDIPSCQVDGNWGVWSEFTSCDSDCGEGTMSRTRLCNDPAPSGGGSLCDVTLPEGEETQIETCYSVSCVFREDCSTVQPPGFEVFPSQYYTFDSGCTEGCAVAGYDSLLNCEHTDEHLIFEDGRNEKALLLGQTKITGELADKLSQMANPEQGAFSFTIWIKPDNNELTTDVEHQSAQTILSTGLDAYSVQSVEQGTGVVVYIATDGTLKAMLRTSDTVYSTELPSYTINEDKFHFIAITWNPQQGLKLFYAGKLADWDMEGKYRDGSTLQQYTNYSLGMGLTCSEQRFHGFVDELAMFGVTLSDGVIYDIYTSVPVLCGDCDRNADCVQEMCVCNDLYQGDGWHCDRYFNLSLLTSFDVSNLTPDYYWPMDEMNGNLMHSGYSMKQRNIFTHNEMFSMDGIVHNALRFDGRTDSADAGEFSNDCILLPDLCSESGLTVSFYLRYHQKGLKINYILSSGAVQWQVPQQVGNTGVSVYAVNQKVYVRLQTSEKLYTVSFDASRGMWVHYIITWRQQLGLHVYDNAVLIASDVNGSENPTTPSLVGNFYIGKSANSFYTENNGQFDMDNLAIYSKYFSDAEAQHLYLVAMAVQQDSEL